MIRSQKFHQFLTPGLREARAYADVLQGSRAVKQTEQKQTDRGPVASFVPAEASHDAIAIALMLDFEHNALVRLIDAGNWLGHNSIQAGAFKAFEPIRCDIEFTRSRGQMDWRHCILQQRFQPLAPLLE